VNKRNVGKFGERIACRYLKSRGYKLVCRNWTCHWGEIDIVALTNSRELVFVEVKYVRSELFLKPYELFTARKRKSLLRAIDIFLEKNRKSVESWRLDLVCVSNNKGSLKIEHYRNVLAEY